VLREQLAISRAGELGSAIGVNDEVSRVVTLVDSHAQSCAAKGGIEKLVHSPTDYAAAKDIQDNDKV